MFSLYSLYLETILNQNVRGYTTQIQPLFEIWSAHGKYFI